MFRFASVLLATFLTACGSSGGGDDAAPPPAATLSVVAGLLRTPAHVDGPLAEARFQQPRGMVHDAAGNLYVADSLNHVVRRVATDGLVTTVAGRAGESGSADGAGAAARFHTPLDVAFDAQGNLLVADAGNHIVRRITPAGVVSTLAGAAGQAGSVDGDAATARLDAPRSVAAGPAGAIYLAQAQSVRKIAADGSVTTFAAASESQPINALAVDPAGNVYIAEAWPTAVSGPTGVVRKLGPDGAPVAFGSRTDGVLPVPFPQDIAFAADGHLLVAASGAQVFTPNVARVVRQVLRVAPDGRIATIAGVDNEPWTVDGPAAVARFSDPAGIAAAPDGRIVVAERGTSALRQLDASGAVATLNTSSGEGRADGTGAVARFSSPQGIAAAADGTLFVADFGNRLVRRVTRDGQVASVAFTDAAGAPLTPGRSILDVAVAGDRLFVDVNSSISVRSVYAAGLDGRNARSVAGSVAGSSGVAVDAQGRLLLLRSREVVRIDAAGSEVVLAAGLQQPVALAVGPDGTVYVADLGDHTVRAIGAGGELRVFAGRPGQAGSSDGEAGQALLDRPRAIAVSPGGVVYAGDAFTVRRISPQGQVRTIAGVAGRDDVQGPGPAAGPLGAVHGLAWHGGALWATLRHAVVKIAPAE